MLGPPDGRPTRAPRGSHPPQNCRLRSNHFAWLPYGPTPGVDTRSQRPQVARRGRWQIFCAADGRRVRCLTAYSLAQQQIGSWRAGPNLGKKRVNLTMLKKLLVILSVVVVLLLAIPAVLSPKIKLDRSIEIQNSAATVHAYLVDLTQYPKWNPFSESDPGSTTHVTGVGLGSTLTWKGDKTGEGKMTVTEIQPNARVQLRLEFITPMAGEALIGWTTEAIDADGTRMTWSMDEDLSYFQRYFGLVMNGAMGKTFEKGLMNLKRQLENP